MLVKDLQKMSLNFDIAASAPNHNAFIDFPPLARFIMMFGNNETCFSSYCTLEGQTTFFQESL